MTEAPTDRDVQPVALSDLKPHPDNARRHRPKDLEASYARFGYSAPILVDERTGYIAAGHGRHALLAKMKADGKPAPPGIETDDEGEWYVPTIRGWWSKDDDELRAYLVADNRQTELGGWELPELAEMLAGTKASPMALSGTGYTPRDLEKMIAPAPDATPVAIENSYDQRADNYRNKQVRSIIFDYPIADYEFVTTTAREACPAFNVETYAELLVAFLMAFEIEHPEGEGA